MKKQLLALAVAAAFVAPQAVGAEGYAVYEWSAEGMGMAGARMFAEDDAANMAYNPASITKVKGKAAKISATYMSPHGKFDSFQGDKKVETASNRIHPAWAPGTYYVQQLNDKEWIGMGVYSRFGLISQFEANSKAGSNAVSSKMFGVSTSFNYARKLDKKWAASLGAEINYVGLQLDKNPFIPGTGNMGRMPVHIEGETYALGWNAAANYEFDDKNEIGVVYRSKITHSMEADADIHPRMPYPSGAMIGADKYGSAYGVVTLPESVSIGYNHKFNDKTRVELNGIWTRWERYDKLNMYFTGLDPYLPKSENPKNWSNGWRYAIGVEHKLSDKYALLAGYAFDESSIPYEGGDFMIPTGTRKTYSLGTQYKDKDQTLAVSIGWMDVGSLDFKGNGVTDGFDRVHTRDSYTKMYSISYQRNF